MPPGNAAALASTAYPSAPPGAMSALLAELVRCPPGAGWDRPVFPGEEIGRFEIIREIGRGGFGVVYQARDRELQREVAFKAVRPSGVDPLHEARLLGEAEAAARLSHPNIVHLYDVGRCDRGPYLVLELLRGARLGDRLAAGPLPAREAVRIAVEASRGLAHAHALGVIHRDVSPGNVFLCEDGQVKVLDFGLAQDRTSRRRWSWAGSTRDRRTGPRSSSAGSTRRSSTLARARGPTRTARPSPASPRSIACAARPAKALRRRLAARREG